MSSFLVCGLTINEIVGYVMDLKIRDPKNPRVAELERFGVGVESGLSRALIAMNEAALIARYGTSDASRAIAASRGRFRFAPVAHDQSRESMLRILKKIRCWLYQCSEGDVYQSPFFMTMDLMSRDLALEIVVDSDEYGDTEGWE